MNKDEAFNEWLNSPTPGEIIPDTIEEEIYFAKVFREAFDAGAAWEASNIDK